MNSSLCFATLALGKTYRTYARLLAIDLQTYAPNFRFLVFTDNIREFSDLANVQVVKHRQQSIFKPYHDKRFVIKKGLEEYNTCVFLDADMRVLNTVPDDIVDSIPDGVSAYFSNSWLLWEKNHPGERHVATLVRQAAKNIGVDIECCEWIYEQVMTFKNGDQTDFDKFFETWDDLVHFFQKKQYYRGEGHSIGLSAAIAAIPLEQNRFLGEQTLFKDMNCYMQMFEETEVENLVNQCMLQHKLVGAISKQNKIQSIPQRCLQSIRRRIYPWFTAV